MLIHVLRVLPRLGEGTVVPDVALVWEAVVHKSGLSLLAVLLDGIEVLVDSNLALQMTRVGLSKSALPRARGQT